MSAVDLAAAIASENDIAERAREIRGDTDKLTPELFLELCSLLREPIPEGFVQTIGVTNGKPYESTGIRSVQVQIGRMDNVLTPLWWWWAEEFAFDGRLCIATVYVGTPCPDPGGVDSVLVRRSSRGGVDRGSSVGNTYKGSLTNALKPAIARIGPGWEVYLGAVDLDPDVNEAAAAPPADDSSGQVGKDIAKGLVDRIWKVPEAKEKLQLAAGHVTGRDIGDCSTKPKAVKAIAALSFEQAERIENWIKQKEGGDG